MKKCIPLLLLTIALSFSTRAQYITIPDPNLVIWLNSNGYAQCMSGSQMDTVCADTIILPVDTLDLSNLGLTNVFGISHLSFYDGSIMWPCVNLSHNNLTTIQPDLMVKMSNNGSQFMTFDLDYNQIDTLNFDSLWAYRAYPENISLVHNGMHGIVYHSNDINNNLQRLSLDYNNLDTLPLIGQGDLDAVRITIRDNKLRHLPLIAAYDFDCGANLITDTLKGPYVYGCLTIDSNLIPCVQLITSVNGTRGEGCLYCNNNLISSFTGAQWLSTLNCSYNNIPVLDSLDYLTNLDASHNALTEISHINTNCSYLILNNNPQLHCIPTLPNASYLEYNFDSTGIACLPRLFPHCNYEQLGHLNIDSIATCDLFNNVYGCTQWANLEGYTYADTGSNCIYTSAESGMPYVKTNIMANGSINQSCYTDWTGHYSFDEINYNTYRLTVDTTGLPFSLNCPDTLYYSAIVDSQELYQSGFNFGFTCKPGFDVGVNSISTGIGWFHPNVVNTVYMWAGDMSALYGLHCAAGISGQVSLTFNGPITYLGPPAGALTPTSVTGNTLTWNIADYGTLNPSTSFAVNFITDTTAQNFEPVCFTATVTPVAGDNNPVNNTAGFCSQVVTAWDPNGKEVYPAGKITDTVKTLTYTVHFKNTGSAAATNVYVMDTLDNHLDATTLKLLSFNHKNVTQVFGTGVVQFSFPFINLPDSAVSDSLSTGYIQYQVNLKNNLPLGTVISNTASIYFDYNAPVPTNAVHDTIVATPGCVNTYDTITHAICQGDTFYVGTTPYTIGGNFNDTLTNAGGCDSVVTLNLSIDSLVASMININGDTFCSQGGAVVLSCQPSGGTFMGTGVSGNQFNPANANTGADTVYYTYTDSNQCSAVSKGYVGVVAFPSNITATYTQSGQNPQNAVTTFSVQPEIAANYIWQELYPEDSLITNLYYSDTFITVCWNYGERPIDTIMGDNYSLTVRAIVYLNGCADTTQWVTITCQVWGGGINQITANNSITLYPNPATDQLFIKTDGINPQSISIYDVDGRLISTQAFKPEIDINRLSSGVYFIEVSSVEGVVRKRFVKM